MSLELQPCISSSAHTTDEIGSLCPDTADSENAADRTISLTSGYRYQWAVVFPDQYTAPTSYPQKFVAQKNGSGMNVASFEYN
jgi:hypothetical protein